MKTITILLAVMGCLNVKGQITLENTYVNQPLMTIIDLEYAGTKYQWFNLADSTIVLYNLDHSIYKQMVVPAGPQVTIWFIRERLWDTDSTDIEYMVTSSPSQTVTVYDELGNTLFFRDSVLAGGGSPNRANGGGWDLNIFNTDSGAVMLLRTFGGDKEVWKLPGYLDCKPCGKPAGWNMTGGQEHRHTGKPGKLYPNPSLNSTTVHYDLPEGVTEGELKIYDLNGRPVKSYRVNDGFRTLLIDNSQLPAGTYLYQLETPDGPTGAKKMVVVK